MTHRFDLRVTGTLRNLCNEVEATHERSYNPLDNSLIIAPPAQTLSDASVTENPRNGRSVGPLGSGRFVIAFSLGYRPAIVMQRDEPMIYHSDFSSVNSASPARAGETL